MWEGGGLLDCQLGRKHPRKKLVKLGNVEKTLNKYNKNHKTLLELKAVSLETNVQTSPNHRVASLL